MINRLKKLTAQLDVIAELLAIANEEADAEQRQHLLAVVGRAHDATRLDLEAAIEEESNRPKLRLIIGGRAGIAVPAGVGTGALARIRSHPVTVAAASTAAASLAIASLLFISTNDPRPSYAERAPIGPVSTSSWFVTGTAHEAPPATTTPGTDASAPAPEVPAVDAAYSSPLGPTTSAGSVTLTPHSPAPSPAGTTKPAPPGTIRPTVSPTWTPPPATAIGLPDSQAGCLRLALLDLLDADVCLLAAR